MKKTLIFVFLFLILNVVNGQIAENSQQKSKNLNVIIIKKSPIIVTPPNTNNQTLDFDLSALNDPIGIPIASSTASATASTTPNVGN